MRPFHIALSVISLCSLAKPNCLKFWQNWKTCPQEQFPDIPRERLLCFRELSYVSEVLISREAEKQSAVLCYNKTFPPNALDCLPITDTSLLMLKDCPFPPPKFHVYFGGDNSTLKMLQINYESHQFLHSSLEVAGVPFLQSLAINSFRSTDAPDLVLESLPFLTSVSIIDHNFTSLAGNPFRNIPQLQVLIVSEGKLEYLTDDTFHGINPLILDLSRNRLTKFPPTILQNMNSLMKLNLSHNSIDTVDLIFENIPHLEIAILSHNNIATLPPGLFSKTPNVTVFLMNHNKLQDIPATIFKNLYHLKLLSLENNRLTTLPPDLFEDLISLLWLDLQFNQITNMSPNLFDQLQSLHVLDLSDNKLQSISSRLPFGKSKFLAKLNISGNYLDELPDIQWLQYNISHLDLSRNFIRQLVLPIGIKAGASVFLHDNLIHTVEIDTSLEFKSLYHLEGNPFYCGCNLSEFIYFMPSLTVADAEKLQCRTPWFRDHKYLTEFSYVPKLCELKDDCPSGCQCELSTNNYTTVNCSNLNATNLPSPLPFSTSVVHLENNRLTSLSSYDWAKVTHLYLTNNSLTSLRNWTFPPMLEFLAIDGNMLRDLPPELMEAIDDSPDFRIYMANNQWQCDCKSIHLKEWLMRNLPKVQDSMRIYCRDHRRRTSLLVETRLDEFICSKGFRSIYINVQGMYVAMFASMFLFSQFTNKFL